MEGGSGTVGWGAMGRAPNGCKLRAAAAPLDSTCAAATTPPTWPRPSPATTPPRMTTPPWHDHTVSPAPPPPRGPAPERSVPQCAGAAPRSLPVPPARSRLSAAPCRRPAS